VSIQNEYSLLCRLFDTDLAELCHNEQVGLLAFSPLACGLLSGKYEGGKATPQGSRKSIGDDLGGRVNPRMWSAVDAYLDMAKRYAIDPVQLAIAWTLTRPFMASSIIGATSTEQLSRVLGATEITFGDDVLAEIEAAHRAHPMPY
jgi:aryl-alcohol dehydrogenase-like predicted oxidoreductase